MLRRTLALLGLAAVLPAAADLGPLDTTYSGDGIVPAVPPCTGCYISSVGFEPLPDGSTLVLATGSTPSHHGFATPTYAQIRRYRPNGELDTTFGNGGAVHAPIPGRMTVQADGSILIAGSQPLACTLFSCTHGIAVARLQANGSPDLSFGVGGVAATTHTGFPMAAALTAGGKVLVTFSQSNEAQPVKAMRLTPQGLPDLAYGVAGVASIGSATPGPASSLFLAGGAIVFARGNELMRLDAGGQPDASFATAGIRALPLASNESLAPETLVLQGDRILVATHIGMDANHALLRVDLAGQPDATFGPNGRRDYAGATPRNMRVDDQGRIVELYRHDEGSRLRVAVRRLTAAGDADASLGGNGRVLLVDASSVSQIRLLSNGKAMVGFDESVARIGHSAIQSDHEFVLQQYRDFLSREGDAFGVSHWESQLASGSTSRSQLILQFLQSAEFQGRIAPVMRLYLAYFLRFPDYAGLRFWVGHSATHSLESISDAFASGGEFAARYGATTNAAFVALIYRNVLGREPEPAGASFWTSQLDSGARTRGQVMLAFSESAEFQATSASEVQVAMTYAGMLRREPDAAGYAYWVGFLDNGHSALALIQSFLGQPEYEGRFTP